MRMTRRRVFHFLNKYKMRILLFCVLTAGLFVTPELTQAQYKWTLNGFNILQAKEFYFDGNYLHDVSKQASYPVSGWNGKEDITMDDMELRNFANALLANREGEDLYYTMNWNITTYDKGGNVQNGEKKCLLSCTEATPADERTLTYTQGNVQQGTSRGSITGTGVPKKDTYKFSIIKGSANLEPGDYVVVRFEAENRSQSAAAGTGSDYTYHRKLSATFRYLVTSSDTFIEKFDPRESAGSRTLDLYIGTGVLPDMSGASQSIIVWWDATALQINAFNKAFQEANSVTGNYQIVTKNGRSFGTLKLGGLGSSAERELGFFKQDDNGFGLRKTAVWFPVTDILADEGAAEPVTVSIARNTKPEDAQANQILGFYVLSNLVDDNNGGN